MTKVILIGIALLVVVMLTCTIFIAAMLSYVRAQVNEAKALVYRAQKVRNTAERQGYIQGYIDGMKIAERTLEND